MFRRRRKPDNRGLSLIEMVCSIAILGIVSLTISGAMIIATNSYDHGTKETAIQQEAQFTINAIENLIVDATDTVTFDGTNLVIQNNGGATTYTISYNSGDETLYYVCTGEGAGEGILAEHVKSFSVDASRFAASRNVTIDLGMKKGASTYTTSYNVTARNTPISSDTFAKIAEFMCDDFVTLEPNQEYEGFTVTLAKSANVSSDLWDWSWVDGGTHDGVEVEQIPTGLKFRFRQAVTGGASGTYVLALESRERATNGVDPLARKEVRVQVRRATGFENAAIALSSGEAFRNGAIYEIVTEVQGTHLTKDVGAKHDEVDGGAPYVSPYEAMWEPVTGVNYESLAQVIYTDVVEDPETGVSKAVVRFKLVGDLEYGKSVAVKATSLHALGNLGASTFNKTGLYYDTVEKTFVLTNNVGLYEASAFLRGDDYVELTDPYDHTAIKGDNDWKLLRDMRYRVAGTTGWSNWFDPISGNDGAGNDGTPGFIAVRPTNFVNTHLDPSKNYEIEIRTRYVDNAGNQMWPAPTDPEGTNICGFYVAAVSVKLSGFKNAEGNVVALGDGILGNTDATKFQLKKSVEANLPILATAAHADKLIQQKMRYDLYRLRDDNTWGEPIHKDISIGYVDATEAQKLAGYDKRIGNLKVDQKDINMTGTYKIVLKWIDDYKSHFSNVSYTDGTGKGVFYFEVVP